MIFVEIYGVNDYLLKVISKEMTKNIANLLEVNEEDVVFYGNEGIVIHNGLEQNLWYAIIRVTLPTECHQLQDDLFKLFKAELFEMIPHFNLIFNYCDRHHMKLHFNNSYPLFVTTSNMVVTEDDDECCDHDECEEIYTGNAFESFGDK